MPPHQQKTKNDAMWIVFMTTFPPRECGLATFTADLIDSFDKLFSPQEETKVIAMETESSENAVTGVPVTDPKVIFRISENKKEDYVAAATYVNNLPQVKVVSIQHEFGIYGQNDGENVLVFLEEVKKPVAVTFHTVLPRPSEHILHIVQEIGKKAEHMIVMTQNSKLLLETVYAIPSEKIKVIAHGIHALPYTESPSIKKMLDAKKMPKLGELSGKKVISTFGLLNRGKGIEFAIDALPAIVKEFPETQYLILGATHPVVFRREGSVYLNQLRQKAEALGVLEHITFYDSYIETKDLLTFLQATDIYLSLSQNPDQAVSGTLTYALGAGRTVVSTPFMQAKEVITDEVGRLIEFNDSSTIADAVITLFKDQNDLKNKSKAAYFRTRGMVWPNIALSYMQEFISVSPELALKEKALPPLDFSHIKHMTDDFAMFQFAVFTEPSPESGYTLDDNARSLVCMVWATDELGKHESEVKLADTYLSFLETASLPGGFVNYYDVDRIENHAKNSTENLEDSNARALWAIAEVYASSIGDAIEVRAFNLFMHQFAHHTRVTSPRAAAFYIKAFSVWLSKGKATEDVKALLIGHMTYYADFLMSILHDNETSDWIWFESAMTYSNAILPEALFLAYTWTKYEHYLAAAKRTMDFLILHSFDNDMCVPIGQAGWFKRGGVKQPFDQQPEEVSALVLGLYTAFTVSKDEKYQTYMNSAFDWFLGKNIIGQVIYSHATGGCYDGLGNTYINLNQGAESTVSYLLARLIMEKSKKI
ncbi:MAG: glycosyltransferase [Patescibacteria group bacterium]